MQCNNCGVTVPQGTEYCPNCGTVLKSEKICDNDKTVILQNKKYNYSDGKTLFVKDNNTSNKTFCLFKDEIHSNYKEKDSNETMFIRSSNNNDDIYAKHSYEDFRKNLNFDNGTNNQEEFFNPDKYNLPQAVCNNMKNDDISITEWFFSLILQFIPLVGLVLLVLWSYSIMKKGIENFSKAMLIFRLLIDIALMSVIIFFMLTNPTIIYNLLKK